MLLLDCEQKNGFSFFDGLIFADQLTAEVEALLPMSATVRLLSDDPAFKIENGFSNRELAILSAARESSSPFVTHGMLVIPLNEEAKAKAYIIVDEVDPALLDKMSADWLLEFQADVLSRFSFIRQIYIEPSTGLYNQRALALVLEGRSYFQTIFLIGTAYRSHTIAGSSLKIRQVSSMLQEVYQQPLFYFGQGIFALAHQEIDRPVALDFSHRLIGRLKREGLYRVHIGFSCLQQDRSAAENLEECLRVFQEAEKRGPFSLCDASFFNRQELHPLAIPPQPITRTLQNIWRSLSQFGLLLIVAENHALLPDLSLLMPPESVEVTINDSEKFILLPKRSASQSRKQITQLTSGMNDRSSDPQWRIGWCHWPTIGTSKIDSIRSCRKAILHAGYYEPGAVVEFDSLSLNVSGDLYFDEGNYKQAIREYRAGLHLKPSDINLLNSLGVALAEVNRHRAAINCFSQVLAATPDNYMALVNKGMSCRVLDQADDAQTCFETALQCKEHQEQGSLELHLQLGRLYCNKELYEKCVDLLRKWQQNRDSPKEFTFFKLLGDACMGAGQNREAIRVVQRSLQIHPHNSDSQSMLGLLYILEGEGDEIGLSLCKRAIANDKSNPDLFHRYATALYHLAQYPLALDTVRKGLQLQRNSDQMILLRAKIYGKKGMIRSAKQSLQRILRMDSASADRKKEAKQRLNKLTAGKGK